MYVFNPSGEKAALVAAGMFNATVPPVEGMTYTWLGECSVSAKTGMAPFAEVARMLPVTVPKPVNGLLLVPKFAGLIVPAPKALPMNSLLPVGSNIREFGATGTGLLFPAVLAV